MTSNAGASCRDHHIWEPIAYAHEGEGSALTYAKEETVRILHHILERLLRAVSGEVFKALDSLQLREHVSLVAQLQFPLMCLLLQFDLTE